MQFRNEIQSDLRRMENEIGSGTSPTFTWKGVEVACVPTRSERGIEISNRGNMVEISLTLIVRRDHFLTADSTLITVDSELYTSDNLTPRPVAGRTLVFRGVTYRIITAKEVAPQSHYELTLADSHSNR